MQTEFNFESKSQLELDFDLMNKKIDEIKESTAKVRRKLFAEVGELKKQNLELQRENANMMRMIRDLHHEKTEWEYLQNGKLFELKYG